MHVLCIIIIITPAFLVPIFNNYPRARSHQKPHVFRGKYEMGVVSLTDVLLDSPFKRCGTNLLLTQLSR